MMNFKNKKKWVALQIKPETRNKVNIIKALEKAPDSDSVLNKYLPNIKPMDIMDKNEKKKKKVFWPKM